ncbi:AraC family transcriptional regulator [Chitinophaga sp. YIM B06452]|uniref:helix-turn-helix transcriptional regulator n=1 Tax=Chitinophaga sp. YIM B06452 TaxID=3082158 RepID=UPI0031FEE191
MAFELKHIATNQVLHQSPVSHNDFDGPQLVEAVNRVELPFADAVLSHWRFNGIQIIHTDWHYKYQSDFAWKADLEIVQLQFNLGGKVSINFEQYEKPITFGHNQHNLLYANGNAGTIANEDLHSSQFVIQFTKDNFLKLTEDSNDALKRFSENVLTGRLSLFSEHTLPIDIPMRQAIDAVLHCKYRDGLKKMFLLSKAIEILVMQAEAFNTSSPRKTRVARTDYDKEQILYAKEYLVQHIETPPSLSELAKVAGLNEYKLKRGFKEEFSNTVFGYLAEKRLELARDYLADHNKSITEIADSLGYSSIHHFSNAFKKKFGRPPRDARG